MTVASKIILALAHRGMSKPEAAAVLGMSLRRFEGKLAAEAFTFAELERLAQAMGARLRIECQLEDGTRL